MTGREGSFSGRCCAVTSCCVLATHIPCKGDTARPSMAATRLETRLHSTEMYRCSRYTVHLEFGLSRWL